MCRQASMSKQFSCRITKGDGMQYKDVRHCVPRICRKNCPRFHAWANCVGFTEIFWVLEFVWSTAWLSRGVAGKKKRFAFGFMLVWNLHIQQQFHRLQCVNLIRRSPCLPCPNKEPHSKSGKVLCSCCKKEVWPLTTHTQRQREHSKKFKNCKTLTYTRAF